MGRTDFKNTPEGDFPLDDTIDASGKYLDTPIIDSDTQHVLDNIYYSKGSLKKYPLTGFGIFRQLNSEVSIFFIEDSLRACMKDDGYNISNGCIYPKPKSGFGIDLNYIYVEK